MALLSGAPPTLPLGYQCPLEYACLLKLEITLHPEFVVLPTALCTVSSVPALTCNINGRGYQECVNPDFELS